MRNKNLCIIPARGGSKRVHRKNIKDFLGKPIIAYSIEAALESDLFEEVIVSTDDDEIAEIARKYGAKTPFKRSKKASDDFATTADVIEEVLSNYETQGVTFENICCIYPCAPFVNVDKLKICFRLLMVKKFDSVFPVVPFGFPIQRALRLKEEKLFFFQPEFALSRSQDLENAFHDAGQFYWIRAERFKRERKVVMSNSGAIINSELETQDIDSETDWKIAELKYQLMKPIRLK